ncbi:MAG: SIS domain-containing protein, partial [Candidatus Methanomethylophilus sp.]|nr:SIS domain-containing protein [Methanomethylophilus sp.]
AIANDCGYEHVFEYQLEGKLVSGDVLIAISGSGNSENVLRAVRYAKDQGCTIIAMTGYNGGKLRLLADCSIHVPINDMQKVEDVHMMALHLMAQTLDMYFGHPMC